MEILADSTVVIYIVILFVSIYGTLLFTSWWVKLRGASSVFMYVTAVFIGQAIETSISLWARVLGLVGTLADRIAFQDSWIWPARKGVLLIALTAMVTHMTYRIFKSEWRPPTQSRRKTDTMGDGK